MRQAQALMLYRLIPPTRVSSSKAYKSNTIYICVDLRTDNLGSDARHISLGAIVVQNHLIFCLRYWCQELNRYAKGYVVCLLGILVPGIPDRRC
jgi:hypothetical protein